MPRTGIWLFPDAPAGRLVELASLAERLGLDEFWLGDEGPAREPFTTLAAAATTTSRIRLGIGVTNPYLRHPAIAAVGAMTLHELSGGRAILGIGPGGNIALGPLGVERTAPLARTRAAVRIIRAVARGEATDGYTPPPHAFTAPDLPIWIGARGEGFNRFASEAADGAFIAGIPLPVLDLAVGWAAATRPIDIAIYVNAVCRPDEVERIRPRLIYALLDAPDVTRERLGVRLADVEAAARSLASGDDRPARAVMCDERLDQVVLRGSPDDVGRRLAGIVGRFAPASVGIALLSPDLESAVDDSAAAFRTMKEVLR